MTASNKNVKQVSWTPTGEDAISIGDPRNFRVALEGVTIEDSAGADIWITTNDLTRRKCAVQIAFGSLATLRELIPKFGLSGKLQVATEYVGGTSTVFITVNSARLAGVVADAQHADVGAHIATFIGVAILGSGEGNTKPVITET